MSNLHAAIGLAQVEKADEYIELRIRNAALYRKYLDEIDGVTTQSTRSYVKHAQWMNGIIIDENKYGKNRLELMDHLSLNNVETRLLFTGMHQQKFLKDYNCNLSGSYPVTEYLSQNGFYLPSASSLTEGNIKFICKLIRDFRG
jgi:perosamine synthetase